MYQDTSQLLRFCPQTLNYLVKCNKQYNIKIFPGIFYLNDHTNMRPQVLTLTFSAWMQKYHSRQKEAVLVIY